MLNQTTFPYPLPPSLKSYAEAFTSDQEKTIKRLRNLLKKRAYDAVGFFLLSWMYRQYGDLDSAEDVANSVRCFVSGSPLLSNASYVLQSPDFPEVVVYDKNHRETFRHEESLESTYAVNDLDSLITQLSSASGIRFSNDEAIDPEADLSEHSISVDEIVSETLANIALSQGNHQEAARLFGLLAQSSTGDEKTRFLELEKKHLSEQ